MSLSSLLITALLRRLQYEFFASLHFLSAIFLLYALWRHISIDSNFLYIYLAIATSIFTVTTIYRYLRIAFRNARWGRLSAKATVSQINDVIRLRIRVPRPWKVSAGDYIYIWMPGVSFWSLWQAHPFMIVWWDQDVDSKSIFVHLLIKPKARFTRKLSRHIGCADLRAWIDGPYGQPQSYNEYGNILMFASDIGIAAQVPCLKELLRQHRDYEACTRKINIIWQLNKESKWIPR